MTVDYDILYTTFKPIEVNTIIHGSTIEDTLTTNA
jgi:hypothetical protein